MRVVRKVNVFSVMQLLNPASLDRPMRGADGDEDLRLGDTIEGPNLLPEDNNEIVDSETFQRLLPGPERICAVLVAEGFDYSTVSQIMGISDYQVRHLLLAARTRLVEAPTAKHMAPLRVWHSGTKTMHYVTSPAGLGPMKYLRLMPWTGFYDVTRERVYLWDIVEAEGKRALVIRWRNTLGTGYIPFSLTTKIDWLGNARVIGNRYETPRFIAPNGPQFRRDP